MANIFEKNKIHNVDWKIGIKGIDAKSIDCVVTDPPYGMAFQSNHRAEKHERIQGDDNLDWMPEWVQELKRVVKDDAHLYIFCSFHKIEVFKAELEKEFRVKNILIWEKNNTSMGDLEGDYAPKYEMIIFCSNGTRKLNGGRDANILKAKRTGNTNHPTEKPTTLLTYLIEKSTQKGETVLDTFAGSFSTAQAAVATGRDYIAFEIEESYCNKARALLSGVTLSCF